MKFILLDDTSDINDNVNNSTILHNIPSTSLKWEGFKRIYKNLIHNSCMLVPILYYVIFSDAVFFCFPKRWLKYLSVVGKITKCYLVIFLSF